MLTRAQDTTSTWMMITTQSTFFKPNPNVLSKGFCSERRVGTARWKSRPRSSKKNFTGLNFPFLKMSSTKRRTLTSLISVRTIKSLWLWAPAKNSVSVPQFQDNTVISSSTNNQKNFWKIARNRKILWQYQSHLVDADTLSMAEGQIEAWS